MPESVALLALCLLCHLLQNLVHNVSITYCFQDLCLRTIPFEATLCGSTIDPQMSAIQKDLARLQFFRAFEYIKIFAAPSLLFLDHVWVSLGFRCVFQHIRWRVQNKNKAKKLICKHRWADEK